MSYFTSIGNFGSFSPSPSSSSSSSSSPSPSGSVSRPHSQAQNPVASRQVLPPSTQMIGVSGTGPVRSMPHIQRNMVSNTIPQNSRNDRKLADSGETAIGLSMGNSGAGYGTYMPFQESSFSRKESHQMPSSASSAESTYSRQFDQAKYVNPAVDIRKGYNSTPSVPLKSNYENYMFEHNANYAYNAERNLGLGIPMNSNMGYDRNGEIGQRRRCAGPGGATPGTVQSGIQGDPGSQYFFQNFETLNKIAENEEHINRFMDRNPVNSRRDEVEKERLADRKQFMSSQGGMMAPTTHVRALSEITPQQTRRNK